MGKFSLPGWRDMDPGQAVLDEQQALLAEAVAAEDAGDHELRDDRLLDLLALARIERIVEGMSRRRPSPASPAGKPAGRARQPRARKSRTPEAQS